MKRFPCPPAVRAPLLVLFLSVVLGPPPAAAQALDGTGTVATVLLLRQMDGVKRVLMIGAHPDDEDTGLLTALARGAGAETAYLSLTRGDGGQNLIGPELWEGLGIVRTGELEAARALDGGRQFFTRAFDFGFSKSAEEALTLWPREELLRDVVWVVRTFRPHVIVSVFSGTPADGHGQHQASGIMAREAFEAAADPERYPEQLRGGVEPWAAAKLYQTSRRRFTPDAPPIEGEVVIPIGGFDPVLGRSSFQLSMASRSQHRSQDMGAPQPPGPRNTSVIPVASRVDGEGAGIFAGIDTTLVGVTEGLSSGDAEQVAAAIGRYRDAVGRADTEFGLDPRSIADELAAALTELGPALEITARHPDSEAHRVLERKRQLAVRALMAASGIVFDVRAADDIVVPGQRASVEATLWNGGNAPLASPTVVLDLPLGWHVTPGAVRGVDADGAVPAGGLAAWDFEVDVPEDADLSRLYYLREGREGEMYRWPDDRDLWALPRDPARVKGRVSFSAPAPGGHVTVEHASGWRYVGVDQASGEFVEPVLVLPRISVRTSPSGMAWPVDLSETREVTVVVRAEADETTAGRVRLHAPAGWRISPESHPFELPGAGTGRALSFEVTPIDDLSAGDHELRAEVVTDDGRRYDEGFALIDYEHIERAATFEQARTELTVLPVRIGAGLRVGYIMGTGDDGPEAIRQMGGQVELLSPEEVRDGAFDRFDVLVFGVRAYEVRPDVRAANDQILDFARRGGTVVNQYNQYQFSEGGYAPYPLMIDRPHARVSVETQPVRILEPEAPVFTTPNRIGPSDFEGWVQERGLYFASEWDDAYLPLLEMNDPGEPPRLGSLLIAPVGEGVYVYTGLSFFRQWSQRVPGAYRLFANLISLEPEVWHEYLER